MARGPGLRQRNKRSPLSKRVEALYISIERRWNRNEVSRGSHDKEISHNYYYYYYYKVFAKKMHRQRASSVNNGGGGAPVAAGRSR